MNEFDTDYVEHVTGMAFQSAVDRLVGVIEKAGMTVFAKIDHAAGAKDVGLSMAPSTVLIFGNARGGTPLMQADPRAALDLPLRILVRKNERGQTLLAFHPVRTMLKSYKLPNELTDRLAKVQQLLVGAL